MNLKIADAAAGWTYGYNQKPYWVQLSTGTTYLVNLELSQYLPLYGAIIGVGVFAHGASGHSALPANMPKVELVRNNVLNDPGTAGTVLMSCDDLSASTSAYQSAHAIYGSTVSHAVDTEHNSYSYHLTIQGEGGANSLVNFTVVSAYIDIGVHG